MFQDWDIIDCSECAGTGIIRYWHKCVGSELVPQYCEECDGTGTIKRHKPGGQIIQATYPVTRRATYPSNDESDIDRKLRAYTSVGDMSPAEFRRLIDGRWASPRKGVEVYERNGEVISMTVPTDDTPWHNGGPTKRRIDLSVEMSDKRNQEMFELDEQDARPTETPYEKYARYMKEQNGVDMDAFSRPVDRRSIPAQFGSIIVQAGRVARAFIRERILVR